MARRPAPGRRVTTQDIDQEEEDHGEEILAHGRISRPPSLPPPPPHERVTARHSIPKVVDRMEHADESGGS